MTLALYLSNNFSWSLYWAEVISNFVQYLWYYLNSKFPDKNSTHQMMDGMESKFLFATAPTSRMTQKSCYIMQLNFEPGAKKGTGLLSCYYPLTQ